MQDYSVSPIGFVQSPFKQKFGAPRQPGLNNLTSKIKLVGDANNELAIKDIEKHSHIWVLFLFHQNLEQGWKPSVRPPRLGGNQTTGVFATRSSFRPNGIGMSAVKLLSTEYRENHWHLIVEGLDLVEDTPVIDIKPYIPYSDAITDATSAMAQDEPEVLTVMISETAAQQLVVLKQSHREQDIILVLQQDPRPAYKKNKQDDKTYAMQLFDLDIKWQVNDNSIRVIEIEQIKEPS